LRHHADSAVAFFPSRRQPAAVMVFALRKHPELTDR
jgi:hypothetical protein